MSDSRELKQPPPESSSDAALPDQDSPELATSKSPLARRDFLSKAATAATIASSATAVRRSGAADNPQMAVFVLTEIHSRALQSLLAAAFPAFEVIAFGRFRDFERKLDERPAAVIAMGNVLKEKRMSASVFGRSSAGTTIEPYVLMSLEAGIDPTKVATVGAVDILGRVGMERVASELLGGNPKVERVSKVQDLLPMLQLQAAQAVLLPERFVSVLQGRSVQKLYVIRSRGGLELPGLVGGAGAAASLRKLDPSLSRLLGVHKWE